DRNTVSAVRYSLPTPTPAHKPFPNVSFIVVSECLAFPTANGAPERLSVANMAAPLLGRCSFFVQRKNRFCKMIAGKGKRFCGEHATMVRPGSRALRNTWTPPAFPGSMPLISSLQGDVEDRTLSHPILQEELLNPMNGDSAHKHLKQQASILGHLWELGLLKRGHCFVEFGAGRGKLSHWIHKALKNPEICEYQKIINDPETFEDLQLLLVERSSTRFK
ncbi:hypothetical protein GOODEAATRI_033518, partial [Goodea atripinnis]